ncbi:MAG: DUF2975 domain-containing protein [Butyribacter sp.]|nr:DUF2975 domain-containing protein [bacterium]MDY3855387.1 DUF2975 domain-containing protein [Butyribacter sp.]
MKHINKIALVVSKIMEIMFWIGTAGIVFLLACSVFARDFLNGLFEKNILAFTADSSIDTFGLGVEIADKSGNLNMPAVTCFCIGAMFTFILLAMIFRNVYLIVKNSKDTPFKADNVRMIREIGIFAIAIPIIGLIVSIIAGIVLGHENIEMSVNLNGFVMGILVLFLTETFRRGIELQNDVDGLL